MHVLNVKVTFLAKLSLLALIILGVFGITFLIPAISNGLVSEYSEFSQDTHTIQTLLTIPAVLSTFVLLEIFVLVGLINKQAMFSVSVYKWVRALGFSALILSGSISVIGFWLDFKNTLPPSVFFVILAGALIALAVSLVTFSLLNLLKDAVAAKSELEGII